MRSPVVEKKADAVKSRVLAPEVVVVVVVALVVVVTAKKKENKTFLNTCQLMHMRDCRGHDGS